MSKQLWLPSRRLFLGGALALGLGATALSTARGAFAEQLSKTPRLTEGPFYPPKLPLDTDNDLLIINDNITQAVGDVTHLTGRVLSVSGEPIRNAVVEIWQCDAKGAYIAQGNAGGKDGNFQGFGRFLTGSGGDYYFRTIKPVPYSGRTPHIHVKVKKSLTTQIFINGHEQNKRDGVLGEIRDPFNRELVLVDFKPLKESKIGELSANFDIVVGLTPAEPGEERRR